jgi:negative regulator of sigma E activity
VAGAVPFVTAGTWMAYELQRFGLGELVCDWSRADIADRIAAGLARESVKEPLARMRLAYGRYHSEESFAQAMRDLAGPRTRHNAA